MNLFGHSLPVPDWLVIPTYLVLLFAISWAVAGGVDRMLGRWAARTKTGADDRIVPAVHDPLVLALFLGGLRVGLAAVGLPAEVQRVGEQILKLGLTVLFALVAMRVLALALVEWGRRAPGAASIAGPASAMGKTVVLAVAVIMAADAVGISIAPLVTTLGLGSLAVALALQDTLANFFSGLYLLADKPVRVGDYVRLASGEEGYVQTIGWRSTRIRQLTHNIVVVPNQKMSQTIVTNFHLPETRTVLLVRVPVAYDADPDAVERLLLAVASDAARPGEVAGLLAEPAPAVRFVPGFADSAMEFTLAVHVTDFETQFTVQSELRKRIVAAFRAHGVEIPFPQRTVHLRELSRQTA